MSLYDNKENKCKFYPTQNLKNPVTLNEINEIKSIQRNKEMIQIMIIHKNLIFIPIDI